MGLHFRGDTARQVDGNTERADPWSDFGSAANRVFDRNVLKVRQTADDEPDAKLLVRAIRNEIIPRLMLVHDQQGPGSSAAGSPVPAIGEREVQEFVGLLLFGEEQPALESVDWWRERGTPTEALYLQLLAPAARLLGEYWTEDRCDFTDVTLALGRLHRMLNSLGHDLERRCRPEAARLSVLLTSAPGEQHTLGLSMVAEFFRQSGWEVCGGPNETTADAIRLLKKRKVDAIGFSLSFDGHLEALAHSIAAVRTAAGALAPCIIVGGPVFALHPEYGSKVKADLVAIHGDEAPDLVRQFVMANQVFS